MDKVNVGKPLDLPKVGVDEEVDGLLKQDVGVEAGSFVGSGGSESFTIPVDELNKAVDELVEDNSEIIKGEVDGVSFVVTQSPYTVPERKKERTPLVKVSTVLYTDYIEPLKGQVNSVVDVLNLGIIAATAEDLDAAADYNVIIKELEDIVRNNPESSYMELLKYFDNKRNRSIDNARKLIVNQGQFIKDVNRVTNTPEGRLIEAVRSLPKSKQDLVFDKLVETIESLKDVDDTEIVPPHEDIDVKDDGDADSVDYEV